MSLFERMSKDKKLDRAKEIFQDALSADHKWQREAREDFAFRDGQQWTADEKRILAEEHRPCLTFNLTKSSIDLIMGMNEDNRIVHRCSPVDPTDGFLAEVMNDITEWVQESNNFNDEEDGALESAACCGRGYVAIDFVPDPKRFGEVVMTEVNVPVHEIHFDPAARRRDLADASYIFWDRWLTTADFRMRYPKISEKRVNEMIDNSNRHDPVTAQKVFEETVNYDADRHPTGSEDNADYNRPMDMEYYDKGQDMIRLIHMEYWCPYKRFFGFNPATGQWEEFPGAQLKAIKETFEAQFGQEFVYETLMDKQVRWLQFTGADVLFDDVSPLPHDGFSIVPVFVFMDASKRTANHYGIVRLLKDPQKEVNKRWSQTLNMLNQQVQTGIYAETDAFTNTQQAEISMKEPGGITWMNSGAITGGKIKERTVPKFPDAPMQLEQYSQDIMKKISGINPDLLGQDRGRQEPGVVIKLRQQQGMTLLKPVFRAVNNMKKELFKRQLAIIMAYMPDQQILRILGSNDRYQIDPQTGSIIDTQTEMVANLRDVRNLEYNIIAEESPGNMSKRMVELTALLEMQGQGFPVPPEQIIEKMSIADSEKQRWLQYIAEQSQAQQKQQEQMMQMEMEIKQRELAIQEQRNQIDFLLGSAKIKQAATKDEIKASTAAQQAEQQLMLEMNKQQAERAKAQEEQDMKTAEGIQQIQLQAEKGQLDLQVQAAKSTQDLVAQAEQINLDMKVAKERLDQLKAEHAVKLAAMKREAELKEKIKKRELELALKQKRAQRAQQKKQ